MERAGKETTRGYAPALMPDAKSDDRWRHRCGGTRSTHRAGTRTQSIRGIASRKFSLRGWDDRRFGALRAGDDTEREVRGLRPAAAKDGGDRRLDRVQIGRRHHRAHDVVREHRKRPGHVASLWKEVA